MTYCTKCGTPRESGSRFCTGCDGQVSTAATTRPRPRSRFVIALTALVLVLGGGVTAWAISSRGTSPLESPGPATPPDRSQTAPAPPEQGDPPQTASALLASASVTTSCPSLGSGEDANGNRFTYEPEKVIDNLPDTAWRCAGDGVGQWLRIDFQSKATLAGIGIVPGFAKTDPHDLTDRYAQNRRISAVDYIFDDGSTVSQILDTSALNRSTQVISLPDVFTGGVTINIRGSVAGQVTGDKQPFDRIAISEFTVSVR